MAREGEADVGPELMGMGSHHPAEYFAESILAPNAVIVDGPGFAGPDGRSIMPSYADSLSVTQLVDLVAFLKSLTGDEGHAHGAAAMEQTAGDYVTVPDGTEKAIVSIGRTTMRVMPSAKGRFAKPVRVEFAWEGS